MQHYEASAVGSSRQGRSRLRGNSAYWWRSELTLASAFCYLTNLFDDWGFSKIKQEARMIQEPMTPLRERMIEEVRIHRTHDKMQKAPIRAIKDFTSDFK
jgi:hypothetical protein